MTQDKSVLIEEFKQYVLDHPEFIETNKEKSLQDLFEEWHLFKDEEKPSSASELPFLDVLKKFNVQDLQQHLMQLGSVLGSVQEVMAPFKQQQQPPTQPEPPRQRSIFSLGDD
ncbi:hypothetical protein FLK61_33185 [Paenalkalicoccus suaedae]|uniref:Cytosolic protein n=1 Tax=Paenalkalicoccus suaedae TaxID=2592382 RepID=A0A859FH81_9BACI|nr:spore coat protein YlbD [Paenalkalicoccus suaedae]QKS71546.1 hypothetical protein FLK61_33185 [Paenalkalicoccus suaedae]